MDNTFGTAADLNSIQPDEKMFALFSHLSLFMGGLIIPVIFWALNKDKSKYVTFHSLQAVWFHIAYIVLIVVFVIFFALAAVIGGAGVGTFAATGNKEMPVLFIIIMIVFYALLFLFIFGAMGYAIYMGIKSYQGAFVKYPIIGSMVYKRVYGINQ